MSSRDLSTHARWIRRMVDLLIKAHEAGEQTVIRYESVAHAMVEARPIELREFVESFDLTNGGPIRELLALAWRIVGNEFKSDPELVQKASEAMLMLCDSYKNAIQAFGHEQE